ncbi:NADP-dependent oxidoreductase [Chitinimonas taiwanensis]|uniref:NADPH:quinone reductase n=1 Tax=Chitinimonas taiwanensis DSM 18899 TaxID=1121279 RepID=A0A1K2H5K8_9NEIS|nr:NADP-dependent oxidoreductase [Chitinimonas taiwanensis]SFZ70843.1 NADPH:quinone reductase [Chitinimonas taiwanensis DSM 18899]
MQAFSIDRYSKQEVGRITEVPVPEVREDEVLVEIHAASVNPLDAKIRSGEFKLVLPYRLPLVLGHDLAGTVRKVGPRVTRFKPGDAVFARADDFRIGSFAEYLAVKEASLAHKPANLNMEESASLPLIALTAWQVLVELAQVRPGQKVFIQAGSGGVGTAAIQLAKHLGAFVATTTSTSNVEWVQALGADQVIDYRKQDFATVLHDYDVVLNNLGSEELEKSLQVLKPGGHLISISGPPTPAFAAAQRLAWPLKQVLRLISYGIRKKAQRRGVAYSFLFMRADGQQLRQIAALIELGAIRPIVDRVFPLDKTADALAYVEQGRAKGKVVIKVK